MMERKIHILFLVFVMAILASPMLGLFGYRLSSVPLAGQVQERKVPRLTFSNLANHEFQGAAETWYQRNFFDQPCMVRLKNQIYEWVNFGMFHAGQDHQVVEGKDHVLFESGYLKNLYVKHRGIDRLPQSRLDEYFGTVKALFDAFEARGVDCVFVLAPDKAEMNPQFIPWWHKFFWRVQSHHPQPQYAEMLEKYGIRYVDGYSLLMEAESSDDVKFFPVAGTHWNAKAVDAVVREMVRKLNEDNPFGHQYRLNESVEIKRVATPLYNDDDVGKLLNVYCNRSLQENVAYSAMPGPKYFRPNDGSVIAMGDSFSGQIVSYLTLTKMYPWSKICDVYNVAFGRDRVMAALHDARLFILVYTTGELWGTPEMRHRHHRHLLDIITAE